MPAFTVDVKRIESIQKQFLIFCLRNLGWADRFHIPSYRHRLQLLNMLSLRYRQDISCCLFAFDILRQKLRSEWLFSRFFTRQGRPGLRSQGTLFVSHHRTTYGFNEIVTRFCSKFNEHIDSYDGLISRQIYLIRLREELRDLM